MIENIRKALREMRWTVLNTRQEKALADGQMVVTMDDLDLEIVDTFTYKSTVWVVLEWDEQNPDNLPTRIAVLVHDLQSKIEDAKIPWANTFKFRKAEINRLGTLYRVSVYVEYNEVINV